MQQTNDDGQRVCPWCARTLPEESYAHEAYAWLAYRAGDCGEFCQDCREASGFWALDEYGFFWSWGSTPDVPLPTYITQPGWCVLIDPLISGSVFVPRDITQEGEIMPAPIN